jgi:hypothetical protein
MISTVRSRQPRWHPRKLAWRQPQRGSKLCAMTTFGLHLTSYPVPNAGDSVATYTRDVAAAAEDSGVFSALWLTDHLHSLGPAGPAAPMPESHVVIAGIAATTSRLDLGVPPPRWSIATRHSWPR